jgi:hypothetical protein
MVAFSRRTGAIAGGLRAFSHDPIIEVALKCKVNPSWSFFDDVHRNALYDRPIGTKGPSPHDDRAVL